MSTLRWPVANGNANQTAHAITKLFSAITNTLLFNHYNSTPNFLKACPKQSRSIHYKLYQTCQATGWKVIANKKKTLWYPFELGTFCAVISRVRKLFVRKRTKLCGIRGGRRASHCRSKTLPEPTSYLLTCALRAALS